MFLVLQICLDQSNVIISSTHHTLVWKRILKMVHEDCPGFWESGGWAPLLGTDEGSASSDSDDGEAFVPNNDGDDDDDDDD